MKLSISYKFIFAPLSGSLSYFDYRVFVTFSEVNL